MSLTFLFSILALTWAQVLNAQDPLSPNGEKEMMHFCNFATQVYKGCLESLPVFPTRTTVAQTLRQAVEPKMEMFAQECFRENGCEFKTAEVQAEESAHEAALAVCKKQSEMELRKNVELCAQNGTNNPSFRLLKVKLQSEELKPKLGDSITKLIKTPFANCKLGNPSVSKASIIQCIKGKLEDAQESVVIPKSIEVITPKAQLEKLHDYCLLKEDCHNKMQQEPDSKLGCSKIICGCRKLVFNSEFKASMRKCLLDNGIPTDYFKEYMDEMKLVVSEIDAYCGAQKKGPCESKKVQKEMEKMEKEKKKEEEEEGESTNDGGAVASATGETMDKMSGDDEMKTMSDKKEQPENGSDAAPVTGDDGGKLAADDSSNLIIHKANPDRSDASGLLKIENIELN